ncbi:x-Pro dipeptidyl-peptidase (S15 family) domain-containing protein [Sarocladium implicatum]|nr:x-Pro dipeptidyl-peptidase (S15 family) domain-containing protein [Sarocladium implicatum]
MAPATRGWYDYFTDRAFGWWCGLPWESSSFTVEKVRIPVEEGVSLVGEIYLTSLAKPHGTIMIRTAYGIGPGFPSLLPRLYATRGYNVLHAACRGTHPEDGCKLMPAMYEGVDGQATVAWMREQPWYTGSFGMTGGSYLGLTQWAILCDPPHDMKTAVINTGPADLGRFSSETGALNNHLIIWADLMASAAKGESVGPAWFKSLPERLKPVYDNLPMQEAMKEYFGPEIPDWLLLCASDLKREDEVFSKWDFSQALEQTTIPILQASGWDDALLPQITRQHGVLAAHNSSSRLIIGPWQHLGLTFKCMVEGFRFMEEHLAGRPPAKATAHPIRIYVTGAKVWKDFSHWPPNPASTHVLYFGPEKGLSRDKPGEGENATSFTFDPREPTPAIALPRPFDGALPASYEDTSLANRPDVAIFTTPPLDADLEIIGTPVVGLHHSSDNPHVDLFVRLSEVTPNGKSFRISDVYQRLDPDREQEDVMKLSLTDCAHRFRKGSRVRVIVAGGAHPTMVRNLGTGENPATGDKMKEATHSIHHSKSQMSSLSLPVVE